MSYLEKVFELLEQIRDFGHAEGCNCSAPVYECGCFEKDQSELAKEALRELQKYCQAELVHESEMMGGYEADDD